MDDEHLGPDGGFRPPRSFPLVAAIFEGGLAVVALCLGWLFERDPLATFPSDSSEIGRGIAWGVAATLPLLAVLWLCVKCPVRPFRGLLEVIDRLLVPLFRDCRVADLAVISLLAGLGEEMLFRGVIQAAVADWVAAPSGAWVGLAVATLLFGLVHRITTAYAVLAGAIGLYLGGIWLLSEWPLGEQNLLVPIVAHALYDFLALLYLAKLRTPLAASQPPV